jgi:MinD-like ATPase involved in chromosome partitioning or flagellar assembly
MGKAPAPSANQKSATENVTPASAALSVVVWGPNGSPGKSSLALNLSDSLAKQGCKVLLVDTDLVSPSLALQLGVEDHASGISAACRLAREANLDAQQLDRISVKISSGAAGFSLLPGISGASRWPEITPSAIEVILRVAATNFDVVVFDTASSLEPALRTDAAALSRNELTRHLIASADRVLAVSGCDPVSLQRMLRQIVDVQKFRAGLPLSLVVNRVRESTFGSNPESQVAQLFTQLAKMQPAHFLYEDCAGHDAALRHGLPVRLAKRRSPYVKSVNLIAEAVRG